MAARPRRLPNVSYVGRRRYFLTFCSAKRRTVFIEDAVVELARVQIFTTARLEAFAILAYCFMPDHVHLLVEGLTAAADLRRFVKLAKQRSGALYTRRFRHALWQKGYYDRVLRERDDPYVIAQYILENPVRAALVGNPRDYPHAGCDLSGRV
jgi:putative transposase